LTRPACWLRRFKLELRARPHYPPGQRPPPARLGRPS
jgi:hypothetical protein